MAATADHSGLESFRTVYFTGGHLTDWCKVSPPPAKTVTIKNVGETTGAVAVDGNSGVTGAASATNAKAFPLEPGEAITLALLGDKPKHIHRPFSVWGGDGAGHPWAFLYDDRAG